MKILLVDDSKTMRNIQRKVLTSLGDVTFGEAGDGVEALAVIAAQPGGFDLAMVDWNMPNMNGLQLVTKIRETNKTMALIMATTEAEKQRVLDALRAGVNNYVVKPFTPEALLEKVQGDTGEIEGCIRDRSTIVPVKKGWVMAGAQVFDEGSFRIEISADEMTASLHAGIGVFAKLKEIGITSYDEAILAESLKNWKGTSAFVQEIARGTPAVDERLGKVGISSCAYRVRKMGLSPKSRLGR